MKPMYFLLCFLAANSVRAQFARTYCFKENPKNCTGVFCEKNTSEGGYFVGCTRRIDSLNRVQVVRTDENGFSEWMLDLPMPECTPFGYSLTDLIYRSPYLFLGVTEWDGLDNGSYTLFRVSPEGELMDSLVFGGFGKLKQGITSDEDGNIILVLKGLTDSLNIVRIHPMTLSTEWIPDIGSNQSYSWSMTRNLHVVATPGKIFSGHQDGAQAKLIVTDTDALSSVTILFPTTGKIVGMETDGEFLYALFDLAASVDSSMSNPLQIIKLNFSGDIIANFTTELEFATNLNTLAIDPVTGHIFIGGSRDYVPYALTGVFAVLSSYGEIMYEFSFENSGIFEIEIHGEDILMSGIHGDNFASGTPWHRDGMLLIKNDGTSPLTESIVSPQMRMNFGNISANINCAGRNWDDQGRLHHVQGCGSPFYMYTPAFSAQDDDGNIYGAPLVYDLDFIPGPVSETEFYSHVNYDAWLRPWLVSRSEIDNHINAFMTDDPSYQIPESILNWPGNGNSAFGQSHVIAPFADLNHNTVYEPLDGEYPLIKGDYCVLSVYNDLGVLLDESADSIDPMRIEIHQMAYGFECPGDSALLNAMFIDYMIINRSDNFYPDFSSGIIDDIDIGNYYGNLAGCDVERGLHYVLGGTDSVRQGVAVLAGTQDEDGEDNPEGIDAGESLNGFGFDDDITDNETRSIDYFVAFSSSGGLVGIPGSPESLYNYMRGMDYSGSPFTFGFDALPPDTSDLNARFMYPDDSDPFHWGTGGSDPGFEWKDQQFCDRYSLSSTQSCSLMPGDTAFLRVALITSKKTSDESSEEVLASYTDMVRKYFLENETPCGQNFDPYVPTLSEYPAWTDDSDGMVIFPNPGNGAFQISGSAEGDVVEIYDLTGTLIFSTTLSSWMQIVEPGALSDGCYVVRHSDGFKVRAARWLNY